MRLTETYSGENDRFEGEQTLWLRSLPQGAIITRAVLTLQPLGGPNFEESLSFVAGGDSLGATRTQGANFIEVDFHARRTLLRASGTGSGLTLQVDMGGAYVGVAADGTFIANGAAAWTVDLTSTSNNLPALTVSRFRLADPTGAGAGTLNLNEVLFRSVPSNLQVGLGQMPPFWVRLGELVQQESSPDFSAELNFFLSESEAENGYYRIPLVIHSDSQARLDASLSIDYLIEQPVLPPHLTDVRLPYDFSTLPGSEAGQLSVLLPRDARPVKGLSGADIRGTFEGSRLALGEAGAMPTTGEVTVSPQCSLAQPVVSDREIELLGIDLPLGKTAPGLAGLNISLVADADGKPSAEVLASAEVKVSKPLPDGRVWGNAQLAESFRLLPEVRHWLVLQSRVGDAFWSVAAAAADQSSLQCSRDGGLSWRNAKGAEVAPPLAGHFRLRHVPENFQIPVQLQIGKGPAAVRRRLDEFAPSGRIEFDFDFADALQEHLDHPETRQPCSAAPGLNNPDFAFPEPDDATRLLFGFDSFSYWDISGSVDLSRGINLSLKQSIVLSVGDTPPQKIDCSGANPQRTSIEEIVAAINRAAGIAVASINLGANDLGQFLRLSAPGEVMLTLHPWCRRGLPDGWQGSGEKIIRFRRNSDEPGFAVLLGDPALSPADLRVTRAPLGLTCFLEEGVPPSVNPGSRLVQRFPVGADCSYQLQYRYQAAVATGRSGEKERCSPEALAPPRWEVEWFDENGQPIEAVAANLEVTTPSFTGLEPVSSVDERLTPPENAREAELRLIHPGSYAYGLLIDELSLKPNVAATVNGDFSSLEGEFGRRTPAGWNVESGWIEEGSRLGSRQGLRLLGEGQVPEDTVLTQTATVQAEKDYQLRITAAPMEFPEDAASRAPELRPRLELCWSGANADPLTLYLDERGFGSANWAGRAPTGATKADIRLIQPRGQGDLRVETVQLRQVEMAEVPLTFLSEAPGELNVRDLKVTYDRPQPPETAGAGQGLQAMLLMQQVAVRPAPGLQDRPVIMVAGVGPRYEAILANLSPPVRTVGDLAALDPAVEATGISFERRLEIKTAAELALECAGTCLPFQSLAGETIKNLMDSGSAELISRSGQSTESITKFQKSLRAQRLLLNNKAYLEMTLGELVGIEVIRGDTEAPPNSDFSEAIEKDAITHPQLDLP